MAGQLAYAVVVNGPDGDPVTITPEQKVPDWAVDQIGDHAYVDDDDEGSGPPPQSGKGSGVEAWRKYAESLGFEAPDEATRDDIVRALADAGHSVGDEQ